MKKILSGALVALATFAICGCEPKPDTLSGLLRQNFITEHDGKTTDLYTLTNSHGMEVCFTNFGGRIVSIMVPDRDGKMQDVCLGHDNIQDYIRFGAEGCNFGALIGRYGNRIAKGKFTLDSVEYTLPCNNNGNSLHGGGPVAFHNRMWDVEAIEKNTITFTTTSPDGEDGYPGNLDVRVTYTVTDNNDLKIDYKATTDKATVVNLTNHCYFNLNGDASTDAMNHVAYINAEEFTLVDSVVAVTGDIAKVEDTPLDFRTPKEIGERIDDFSNEQMKNGGGYDHNWVLSTGGNIKEVAAVLYSPKTGINMAVFTDQPGVQFYAGNFLDGSFVGKGGVKYPKRSGLCFETQHFPDGPNQPHFPSTVLRPGDTYSTTTIYQFTTDKTAQQ